MQDHGVYTYKKLGGVETYYQTEDLRFFEFDNFFLPYDELMKSTHRQEFWENPEWQEPDYDSFLKPDVKRFPIYVRPGIDLIKLGFSVKKVDWAKLNEVYGSVYLRDRFLKKYGFHISIQDTEVQDKRLDIAGNSKYQSVIVSSDKFKMTMKKTNFREKQRPDSMTIELNVDTYWHGAGNIENQSYGDVNVLLKNYIQEMEDLFGICIEYESLIVTYMEVNMTFDPMGDTSELIRLLSPFQTFLPKSFNINEDYKYKQDMKSSYEEKTPLKIMKYNGMRAKSTTIGIKLYDKKYQHNSEKNSKKIKTELLRIEFAVYKPKQIRSHFRTEIWSELTEQDLKQGFFDMFDHYIYRNYKKYTDRGKQELKLYFKTIDITDRNWRKKLRDFTEKFYRDSAGGFLAFSKDDIKLFVEQIEAPSVKSNKSRICKSVEEILIPKTDNHPRDRWIYLIRCLLDFSRQLQEFETLQYMIEFDI